MTRRHFLHTTGTLSVAACLAAVNRQSRAQPRIDVPQVHAIDRLHQIFIRDGFNGPSQLPENVQETSQRFRNFYPAASYTLWTEETLREFIAHHFDRGVLDAFDQLIPNAYKCDLAKYCLLYELGGQYSDLGLEHYCAWQIPKNYEVAGFLEGDLLNLNKYDITNGVLWAKRKSPTFEAAIEGVVRNCRDRFHGNRAIDPTGPGLLGWAWATAYLAQTKNTFDSHQYLGLTAVSKPASGGFDMKFWPMEEGEQPIAMRLPRMLGDTRYLGGRAKSYLQMWRAGEVYR